MRRFSIALATMLVAIAQPTLAQNIGPAEAFVVCRTAPGTVAFKVRLSMSPCWSFAGAEAEYPDQSMVIGTIATSTDAETCIQSLMPTEFNVTVVAGEAVTRAAVTVLDPGGNPIAMDFTDIVTLDTECPEMPR